MRVSRGSQSDIDLHSSADDVYSSRRVVDKSALGLYLYHTGGPTLCWMYYEQRSY